MQNYSRFIQIMNDTPVQNKGYDVIIISNNNPYETPFWEERLCSTRGVVTNSDVCIISVFEDWKNEKGAGNLLGTLYAWGEADRIYASKGKGSLSDALKEGKSIAMYHIAGLGTRMAPLPSSECNSKSAVKLPFLINVEGQNLPMTILEAVLLQTGPFAASRKGRLSVWWGDQIFIPENFESTRTHHVEILAKKVRVNKDLENYGLLLLHEHFDASLREKMPIEKILNIIPEDSKGERTAGMSLGSFSVSCDLLFALLDEYDTEIRERIFRLNTDADLWQPLTSSYEDYIASGCSGENWKRITSFWKGFEDKSPVKLRRFGYLDIGDSYWWDFGQAKFYQKNLLLMLKNSNEARVMRDFFRVSDYPLFVSDSKLNDTDVSYSVILGSDIKKGNIKNSILVNSDIYEAQLDECIIIDNICLGKMKGKNSVSYRNIEEHDVVLNPSEVSAGIFLPPSTHFKMRLDMTDSSGNHWKDLLLDNRHTFAEVWQMQRNVDRKEQESCFRRIRDSISLNYRGNKNS